MGIINLINDLLWTYILVALLLGCAVWFTLRTRFVQFRMIKEMVRLLGDSGGKGDAKEKHISSFQAFAISIASRVGTGNLAGVATAIAVGGPGAVFWMWVIEHARPAESAAASHDLRALCGSYLDCCSHCRMAYSPHGYDLSFQKQNYPAIFRLPYFFPFYIIIKTRRLRSPSRAIRISGQHF